jgi:hypothetical protein
VVNAAGWPTGATPPKPAARNAAATRSTFACTGRTVLHRDGATNIDETEASAGLDVYALSNVCSKQQGGPCGEAPGLSGSKSAVEPIGGAGEEVVIDEHSDA